VTRTAALLLLLAPPLFVAAQDEPEPPAKGKGLRGDWVFARAIGKQPGPPGELSVTFEKDKMVVKMGPREKMTHAYKIDPKTKPAHIDLTDSLANKSVQGIYKIEKGELFICIGERKGGRPTTFDGSDEPVIVFKRPKK